MVRSHERPGQEGGSFREREPSIEDLLKTIEQVVNKESLRISERNKFGNPHDVLDHNKNQGLGRKSVSSSSSLSPYPLVAPLNPQEIRIPPLVLKNPLPGGLSGPNDPQLLSRDAFISVTQTFSELSRTITQKTYSTPSTGSVSGNLDARVMGLLKNLVKEWIDEHMPSLVEDLVKRELEAIKKSAS